MSFRKQLMFMTPGLPFVPAIAVTVNIYLIFKLSILTLVRFTVWMIVGMYSTFVLFRETESIKSTLSSLK